MVEVQDCRKINDHFGGIYSVYPNLIKENRRMWICNRLDLPTPESQPVIYAQKSPWSLVDFAPVDLSSRALQTSSHMITVSSSLLHCIHSTPDRLHQEVVSHARYSPKSVLTCVVGACLHRTLSLHCIIIHVLSIAYYACWPRPGNQQSNLI